MAEEEKHSSVTEASSSDLAAVSIKEASRRTWAQIEALSSSGNRKNAASTKKNSIQTVLEKSSTQKLVEQKTIEQRFKTDYLDSSSSQPQNNTLSADRFSLPSTNQSGVASPWRDVDGQPNPITCHGRRERKEAAKSSDSCRKDHVAERCSSFIPVPDQVRKKGEAQSRSREAAEQLGSEKRGRSRLCRLDRALSSDQTR